MSEKTDGPTIIELPANAPEGYKIVIKRDENCPNDVIVQEPTRQIIGKGIEDLYCFDLYDGLIKIPNDGKIFTMTCNGCEEQCVMPVEIRHKEEGTKGPRAFIVCDGRDETGFVSIQLYRLVKCGYYPPG